MIEAFANGTSIGFFVSYRQLANSVYTQYGVPYNELVTNPNLFPLIEEGQNISLDDKPVILTTKEF